MHLPTIYLYCLSLRLLWTISTLLLNSFSIKGECNIKDQMSKLKHHCIIVRLNGMTWTHLLHYGYHLMKVRFYTFCGAYYPSFSRVLVCLLYSMAWNIKLTSSQLIFIEFLILYNSLQRTCSQVETNLADKTILFSVYTTIWILRDV